MGKCVCEECIRPVKESANRCGNCGYNPAAGHVRWRKIDGVLGGLLIMSVIGSPVGLYLVWRAWRHSRAAKKATPAVPA